MIKYFYLSLAIIFEVIGTLSLKASHGFTKIIPSIVVVVTYIACFYFLSLALNYFKSVGFIYAIWAGIGIVLVTVFGVILFKNVVDLPGVIGLSLIVAGAVILNIFSRMAH